MVDVTIWSYKGESMIYKRLRSTIAAATLQRCGKYLCLPIALLSGAGPASTSLIYQLTPAVYTTTPGGTVETFATITNTGPDTLFYAFSFVDPGTVPAAGVTGQLPPAVLQPGDQVSFTAGTLTTDPQTQFGEYNFTEGVGYHPGLGVQETVEARDVGTLFVIPEPASFVLLSVGLLAVAAGRALLN